MATLAVDDAHMIGLICALLLYGVYISLFATTMWVYKVPRGIRVDTVRLAVVILFVLSTASIVVLIIDNRNAWLRYRVTPGSLVYFNRKDNLIGPCKDLLLYSAAIVGDILIVWRLYMVWSRSRRIIVVPIVTLVLYGIAGITICFFEFHSVLYLNDDRFGHLKDVTTFVAIILGFVTNVYTTAFIVGRMWLTGRQTRLPARAAGRATNWYMPLIRALVGSAALYTLLAIATIIVSASVKNGSIIFGYLDPMGIGIAPTLLVLQLNLTRRKANEPSPSQSPSDEAKRRAGVPELTTIRFSPIAPWSTISSAIGTFSDSPSQGFKNVVGRECAGRAQNDERSEGYHRSVECVNHMEEKFSRGHKCEHNQELSDEQEV
ncbi:hypothetical protein FRB93_004904 [Tulasnella sp. JGI-2019a]|nr:hypothetical protein FRB93_004904 [Tulasnella sp. JGI-2019a]